MENFDVSQPESRDSYSEKHSYYFEAHMIDSKHKWAVLLIICQARAFTIIQSLIAPALPQTQAYDEIITLLKAHLSPMPSVSVQLFQFHK